ncbi:MAG: hypothetical protein PHH70_02065 [Candidatus Gracilibacteria bacterium]|nr:hypothetical protein [Candidatus Gracilibacteria bacterium]
MKRFCFTSFSVVELKNASQAYAGFDFQNISDFENNAQAYEKLQDSRIDVVYVFSRLLSGPEELGGVLGGSIFISQEGLFGLDESGNLVRIPEGSVAYLLRTGDMPKSFLAFLVKCAKKQWNIQVITNLENPESSPLSTKCHALAYMNSDNFPKCVVPYVCSNSDFSYLIEYLKKSELFGSSVIAKKAGYSSGDGVKIFNMKDVEFQEELFHFIEEALRGDYVVMELLDVSDTEYRVYWAKKGGGEPTFLEVHGKERIEGQVLHNIAKGNVLRKLDKKVIPENIQKDLMEYCQNIPELHGGIDILVGTDGKYYFTENNIMTGYLCEPEERYFAKEWLESVASCHTL